MFCILSENRLAGVHVVKMVAARMAIPVILRIALPIWKLDIPFFVAGEILEVEFFMFFDSTPEKKGLQVKFKTPFLDADIVFQKMEFYVE